MQERSNPWSCGLDYGIVLLAEMKLAYAWPAVPLGLWSITSSLCWNFYVPHLHKFIKWFDDNCVAQPQVNLHWDVCDIVMIWST